MCLDIRKELTMKERLESFSLMMASAALSFIILGGVLMAIGMFLSGCNVLGPEIREGDIVSLRGFYEGCQAQLLEMERGSEGPIYKGIVLCGKPEESTNKYFLTPPIRSIDEKDIRGVAR